jgi:glucosamine kinase
MSNAILIGIDGGATRCRARIADRRGQVLGEAARKASANIASRNAVAVMNVVLAAVRSAARNAGLDEADWRLADAGLGLAGADMLAAREELTRLLAAQRCFRRVTIRTDAYVTWLGAFGGEDGAILILGTGSCGLAVVGGKEAYVSGYGPRVSDEASGQWLGRAALIRALWAYDGRIKRCELADAVLARFENSPERIVAFANRATPAEFGDFAPMVFNHADRQDPLALELISEATADAMRMIDRLLELGAPAIYLHGGMAERLAAWLPVRARKHLAEAVNVEAIPLQGAVLMAGGAGAGR